MSINHATLSAALDALQQHGIVPSDRSLTSTLAHPLHGRLVRVARADYHVDGDVRKAQRQQRVHALERVSRGGHGGAAEAKTGVQRMVGREHGQPLQGGAHWRAQAVGQPRLGDQLNKACRRAWREKHRAPQSPGLQCFDGGGAQLLGGLGRHLDVPGLPALAPHQQPAAAGIVSTIGVGCGAAG